MAYKRISPMPIIEGGTNASTYGTVDGTVYFDGTRLVDTTTGTSGQILTSNGNLAAPTYQSIAVGGISFVATGTLGTGAFPLTANQWGIPFGAVFNVQAQSQWIVPIAGTISNLYVNVYQNSAPTNVTITVNKNSVNTTVVATITATTTGVYSDTTHTVSFAAGDLLQFEFGTAASGTLGISSIACVFTAV